MKILNKIKELTNKQKIAIILLVIVALFVKVKNSEFMLNLFSPVNIFESQVGTYQTKTIEVDSTFYENAIYIKFSCDNFENVRYKVLETFKNDEEVATIYYGSTKSVVMEKISILKKDIFYKNNSIMAKVKIPSVTKRQFKQINTIGVIPIKLFEIDIDELKQLYNFLN